MKSQKITAFKLLFLFLLGFGSGYFYKEVEIRSISKMLASALGDQVLLYNKLYGRLEKAGVNMKKEQLEYNLATLSSADCNPWIKNITRQKDSPELNCGVSISAKILMDHGVKEDEFPLCEGYVLDIIKESKKEEECLFRKTPFFQLD